MKKLKILVLIPRYDYGKVELGDSFEYDTFYRFFVSQGHEVTLVDYVKYFNEGGESLLETKLHNLLHTKVFDFIFAVPFTNQLSNSFLDKLKCQMSGIPSVAWMCDDKWRWETFSKFLAPHFDYMITTDPGAVAKYHAIGFENVILSQWGFDPHVFKPAKQQKVYEISFIGGISAWREYAIHYLRRQGFTVTCFGKGWEKGKVSVSDMVEIYNQSKVVLNLSNSTQFNLKFLTWHRPYKRQSTWKLTLAHSFPGLIEFISSPKRKEDIKARFFEVLGSGAFLLSYNVEYLEKYLQVGQDFVSYDSLDDLVIKLKYFLSHSEERQIIAEQGYRTALAKHTYAKRFQSIFTQIKW